MYPWKIAQTTVVWLVLSLSEIARTTGVRILRYCRIFLMSTHTTTRIDFIVFLTSNASQLVMYFQTTSDKTTIGFILNAQWM